MTVAATLFLPRPIRRLMNLATNSLFYFGSGSISLRAGLYRLGICSLQFPGKKYGAQGSFGKHLPSPRPLYTAPGCTWAIPGGSFSSISDPSVQMMTWEWALSCHIQKD